jgi:hypothetical protein
VADANVAIGEPGPGTWPHRVEPQLEQDPCSEVSGDWRTVHRFDVLEGQTVHGLSEGSFDAPKPVGLQGLELLIRDALPAGKSVHMVGLYVAKRPHISNGVPWPSTRIVIGVHSTSTGRGTGLSVSQAA